MNMYAHLYNLFVVKMNMELRVGKVEVFPLLLFQGAGVYFFWPETFASLC